MRKSVETIEDTLERAPLKDFEEVDDEHVLAVRHRQARRLRPGWRRLLPWCFLAFVFLVLVVLPQGGWYVLLCTSGLVDAPLSEQNVTLVALHGVDFPYPPNTLQAMRVGVRAASVVNFDVAQSSDGELFAIKDPLQKHVNASGFACNYNSTFLKALEVEVPDRDPNGRYRTGQPCEERSIRGKLHSCVYRIPTVDVVFGDMPHKTVFMLNVHHCGVDKTPTCAGCKRIVTRLKELTQRHFIAHTRLIFQSSNADVLATFMYAFPDARLLLDIGSGYAHYPKRRLAKIVREQKCDGVTMPLSLASWRPDVVSEMSKSLALRTSRPLVTFVYTITGRRGARAALCANVPNLMAAQAPKIRDLVDKKAIF